MKIFVNLKKTYSKNWDFRVAPVGVLGKARPSWFSCLKLIPDTDAVSHLTIWHKTNSPRATGTPIIRRSREFWHSPSSSREHGTYIRMLARLAGDCELNGTREFNMRPRLRWVTGSHVDWPTAVVTTADVGESQPSVPESSRCNTTLCDRTQESTILYACRTTAMQLVNSFMLGYTRWSA